MRNSTREVEPVEKNRHAAFCPFFRKCAECIFQAFLLIFVVISTNVLQLFADVELETGCLDPNSIIKKVSKNTKAIIVVHQFGIPANMDASLVTNNIVVIHFCFFLFCLGAYCLTYFFFVCAKH